MEVQTMLGLVFILSCVQYETHGSKPPSLVYQWISLDLKWPNDTFKQQYIDEGWYKAEENALNGIKLYNDTVYLTIPRLKPGVPVTLVRVIEDGGQTPMVEPFPSWDMHRKGDCNTFQLIQSMEIDPDTGYMWILDTAYVPSAPVEVADRCPAKLVIYDLVNNKEVHRHEFEKSVVGPGMFYLNDIVLDKWSHDRSVQYAYISDTLGRKLVVYDRKMDKSWSFAHSSMMPDSNYENVTISNSTTNIGVLGINGIALSSDFKYVYYSSVAGVGLYQVPTSVLKDSSNSNAEFKKHVRHVGDKISQSDGMYYGKKDNLYFSTLGENAVYKWSVADDMSGGSAANAKLNTQDKVSGDNRIEWVDSLGMDENGYLWFTSNNLHTFFNEGNKTGKWNYFVWKVFVDDSSYLNVTGLEGPVQGAGGVISSILCIISCFLMVMFMY